MKLSRTYRTRLRTPSSSVVKTLEVVHQLMRSPFQNEEAHRSVGMVCFADIFSLEVLSGFIVMFCRIWTQHLNFQELVGHSSCTSEFREWVARHDQRLCKYVLNICEAAKKQFGISGAEWFLVLGPLCLFSRSTEAGETALSLWSPFCGAPVQSNVHS